MINIATIIKVDVPLNINNWKMRKFENIFNNR